MLSKRKKIAKKQLKKGESSYDSLILPVILGVLFFVIVGFLIFSNWRIGKKRVDLQSQIQNLQEQLKSLEDKKAQLESSIQQGQSETFLEEQAREKLGLKKPGEEVVSVLPPTENQEASTSKNKSLWQKFLERIGF